MKKIVFIDRDGTIIREPRDKQIDSLEKLEFIPGIISGLKLLVESGFSLVMVSNQDRLGTTSYPKKVFATVQKKLLGLLEGEGITFQKILICPHRTSENCECRKPKIGLVKQFLSNNNLDFEHSFVLGDRETDVKFANNIGVRSVRLTTQKSSRANYIIDNVFDACKFIVDSFRSASLRRKTGETDIVVHTLLNGLGTYKIDTGIRFFDHMLAQLSSHSQIDMNITAKGDLDVDEHHTVEDVGIALGECIRQSLGDKKGIERFGFAAPLDEAIAEVAIDLSGRSFLSFHCTFKRERVGELPTELIEDFFRGFVDGLKATLHISCRGRNDHHKIEAMFKSVARALNIAVRIDSYARRTLPSTKGML